MVESVYFKYNKIIWFSYLKISSNVYIRISIEQVGSQCSHLAAILHDNL